MTILELKALYLGAVQKYFPQSPISSNILSENSKRHKDFERLLIALDHYHINPNHYFAEEMHTAERRPTAKMLYKKERLEKYIRSNENGY